MKSQKKFTALLLAGMMMLSVGTDVFAAVPTVDKEGTVSVHKDFVMAEGIAAPAAEFKFTAVSATENAPTATIANIVFAKDEKGKFKDGVTTISKESAITFGAFPHAGEYVYTVQETAETAEGVEYDTQVYTLRVYVKNTADGGLAVRNMTAEKGTSNGTETNKAAEMKFTNTYRKNTSLSIIKKTEGELADKTKDFTFTITMTPSATEEASSVYIGKIGEETVEVTAGIAKEFTLHDGQRLVFAELPAGTRYVVTENGASDGYTPSVTVLENGVKTVDNEAAGQEQDGLSSVKGLQGTTNLAGEGENSVTFTNTYKEVPITGIILKNLPFVILIGAAAAALAALAILKKQKISRR